MSNLLAFPTPQEFSMMKEMGTMLIASRLLPTSISKPEQALAIMLKGRELGIPPMQAFSSIAIINGKPTMTAELMLSMIHRNIQGVVVDFENTDSESCTIDACRPGGKKTRFTFSMDDARRANLAGKGPWVTYPAAMLRARCISSMARAMFPDALSGVVYTAEELGENVDDEGAIVVDTKPKDVAPIETNALVLTEEIVTDQQGSPGDVVFHFGRDDVRGKAIRDVSPDKVSFAIKWINDESSKSFQERDETKLFVRAALAHLRGVK